MWNRHPPPGFQGLHPDKPVTVYQRHLPHWRQDGATYFVTFRLADSLPQTKLEELRAFKSQWEQRHPPPHSNQLKDELAREVIRRIERWLDQGMGACHLRKPQAAEGVVETMHHFDGDRYELGSYAVMPNHIHAIVRPLMVEQPLEKILQSWKRVAAKTVNDRLRLSGTLWQEESFDRIIRDQEHLYRTIQYIGRNPKLAGLEAGSCPRWVSPAWEELGWGFEDESESERT